MSTDTEELQELVLKIQENDQKGGRGPFIHQFLPNGEIFLDGFFSANQLRAIANWLEKEGEFKT